LNFLYRNCVIVALFSACLLVTAPLKPLLHAAFKRLVLGKVRDGEEHPLRSAAHLRWMAVTKLARMPALDAGFRHVYEYAAAYARGVGARVGTRARFYPWPSAFLSAAPEADVLSIGDRTVTSAATYGHDFSALRLQFRATSLGRDCDIALSRYGQVLPGSALPDGSSIHGAGRATHLRGLALEPNRAWTGNPVGVRDLEEAARWGVGEFADAV